MRVGRNDACPCGSGKKFKSCCEGKSTTRMSRGLILLVVVIAAIAAIGVIPALIGDRAADEPAVAVVPQRRATPQPGPAPAGKVWSAEHGHWHDAPKRTVVGMPSAEGSPLQVIPQQVEGGTIQPPVQPRPLTPQPPGEVPAGKVWSPEHGHWHDAPAQ